MTLALSFALMAGGACGLQAVLGDRDVLGEVEHIAVDLYEYKAVRGRYLEKS